MKIPEKDWGYSFNHPKLIHRHTNKFRATPLPGQLDSIPTEGDWHEEWFWTNPGEAYEYEWVVPAGVEWVYVFGAGGGSLDTGPVGDQTFGMFVKPVTPGSTISVVVGCPGSIDDAGLPDGGPPGFGEEALAYGGGGSTTMSDGGGILYVAPGGGGISSDAVPSDWTHWGSSPGLWIGSSMVNPTPTTPSVPIEQTLESYSNGSPGSGASGGAGADWVLSGDSNRLAGGGGGGGYGGGPGGPVYKGRQEGSYWHYGDGGRAGRPYVGGDATYAGAPFTELVNGTPLYLPYTSYNNACGYLYLRWLE